MGTSTQRAPELVQGIAAQRRGPRWGSSGSVWREGRGGASGSGKWQEGRGSASGGRSMWQEGRGSASGGGTMWREGRGGASDGGEHGAERERGTMPKVLRGVLVRALSSARAWRVAGGQGNAKMAEAIVIAEKLAGACQQGTGRPEWWGGGGGGMQGQPKITGTNNAPTCQIPLPNLPFCVGIPIAPAGFYSSQIGIVQDANASAEENPF
ncbi:hypothetical protein B0H13DRAFT_1866642 [Mycena leptocephala]|nr:hypothetical protein B0H13DRAFT_1866642 [Mycena leptocephala]